MGPRRRFSREFKRETIRLVVEGGVPLMQAMHDRGLHHNTPGAGAGAPRRSAAGLTSGEIFTYDADGKTSVPTRKIPGWLSERLKIHWITVSPPGTVKAGDVGLPAIKVLAGDGLGRAVLFYVTDDEEGGFAVRYDPADGAFIRLGLPADSVERQALRNAWGADLKDSILVVTRPSGTYLFKVRGE